MTAHFSTQRDLETAMQALIAQDARLQPLLAATGMPALRQRAPGFAGLAAVICGQQLSTFAAAAIWARVVEAFGEPEHHHFRKARADRLRRIGLSAAKIKTLRFIAGEIHQGRLDLATLADLPADEAHKMLTALHGIGPWTADIYLLFCLGNADAWPAGDLALQEAARIVLGLNARPTVKEMISIGDSWRPYRGAAAHLLWAYYRVAKRATFEAAPPDAATVAPAKRAKSDPRTELAQGTTTRAKARVPNGRMRKHNRR
jgi:DNA-3-methyladenine glycosylase II